MGMAAETSDIKIAHSGNDVNKCACGIVHSLSGKRNSDDGACAATLQDKVIGGIEKRPNSRLKPKLMGVDDISDRCACDDQWVPMGLPVERLIAGQKQQEHRLRITQ